MNLGDDGKNLNYIIPKNYIAGRIRGTRSNACSGNVRYPNECYPNGGADFKVGDIIDFTWGMPSGQGNVVLIYAIDPSG